MDFDTIQKLQNDLTEEASDIQDSPIKKLNYYCLIHIFNFLPDADRIRVERVIQGGGNLAKPSWRQFKELRLDPKILGLRPNGTSHQYPIIIKELSTRF